MTCLKQAIKWVLLHAGQQVYFCQDNNPIGFGGRGFLRIIPTRRAVWCEVGALHLFIHAAEGRARARGAELVAPGGAAARLSQQGVVGAGVVLI